MVQTLKALVPCSWLHYQASLSYLNGLLSCPSEDKDPQLLDICQWEKEKQKLRLMGGVGVGHTGRDPKYRISELNFSMLLSGLLTTMKVPAVTIGMSDLRVLMMKYSF